MDGLTKHTIMDTLKIPATDESPEVILDAENNIFQFSGMSHPEDVTSFYKPVLDWIDQYALSPNLKTKFIFKLGYFNTASAKVIMDILVKLEEIYEKGNEVLISWQYREDDEDMQDAGEEYADLVEVPFEQVSY